MNTNWFSPWNVSFKAIPSACRTPVLSGLSASTFLLRKGLGSKPSPQFSLISRAELTAQ